MHSGYLIFKSLFDKNEIGFRDHKFNSCFKNYSLYQLQHDFNIKQNLSQKIAQSQFAVIDLIADYFTICFENQIILINSKDQLILKTFFSNFDERKSKLFFLENVQAELQKLIPSRSIQQEDSLDMKNFYTEIESFKDRFKIRIEYEKPIQNFWAIISSCLAGYLIKKSCMKSNDDTKRLNFLAGCIKKEKPYIFYKESDFILLRSVETTNTSTVYLAYHIEKQFLCVLKFFSGKLANREIENYKGLNHLFIHMFYGLIKPKYGSTKAIVIEYIKGRTFQNIKEMNLNFEQKIIYIIEMLYIFQCLYFNQFIYRDLKPKNIMLNENNQIVLIDFDRLIKYDAENEIDISEYTRYFDQDFAPPEIYEIDKKPSLKSDIYSIGMMIYYFFMEKRPVKDDPKLDFKMQYPEFFDIFQKCANQNEDKRPSIGELIQFFEGYMQRFKNPKNAENAIIGYQITNKIVYKVFLENDPKKIGDFFISGECMPRDVNVAMYFYKMAADKNDPGALFNLGNIYYYGIDLQKDIKIGIQYFTLAANQGHCFAQFLLGHLYINGHVVPKNFDMAFHYFSLAAQNNYGPALNCLGNFYIDDDYMPRNINKALHYYSLAAEQNNAYALANLGILYYEGKILNRDITKSIYYLTRAAEQNHLRAQFLLGSIYAKNARNKDDIEKAIYYFNNTANQNDIESQHMLGLLYLKGELVPKDTKKAILFFTLAANQNFVLSQVYLGFFYLYGYGVLADVEKAILYLTCAAKQNDASAQFQLGQIYYDNKYGMENINKSIYYYEQAAYQGHIEAQFCLGYIFYENVKVPIDIDKAVFYLSLAANNNHPIAQNNLGAIYYSGQYVPKDLNKSIHYFTLAASQNNVQALMQLGILYHYGFGVPQDTTKAIHYLTLAANQKCAQACSALGAIYFEGKVVKKDIKKALHYYTIAADQNSTEALNNLAVIYMQNEVVQRNMEKVIHYLKRASDLNVTLAQKGLGSIYYNAYYVPRDINKAIHYFLLAAKKEEPMSQFYLGKIYFYGDNVPRDIKKGLLYIELAAKNKSREAQLFLGHIYLEGKYVDRDILKSFSLYKEVSSFYNNFAKNNLGVIYKHGHKEINKNISLSKEYFTEAIKQMNDPVSMYNLANILLDEAEPDDDCQNSLEMLVRSASQRFYPSIVLLCLVLMRKHEPFNLDVVKNKLKKYGKEHEYLPASIYSIFVSAKKSFDVSDEYLYQLHRNIDFVYINDRIVVFQSIDMIQKYKEIERNRREINEHFYDGFGYDLLK